MTGPAFAVNAAEMGRLELRRSGVDVPMTISVPGDIAASATEAGELFLTDTEGVPVATMRVARAEPTAGAVRLEGPVDLLGEPNAGPFPRLRFDPEAIRTQLGGRPLALTLDRPLTSAEEAELHELGLKHNRPVLLLPCTGEAGSYGVPPEVTVRAAQAMSGRLNIGGVRAVVATLPLVVTEPGVPPEGSGHAADAVDAALLGTGDWPNPIDPDQWALIRAALDAPETATSEADLSTLTSPDSAALLRWWRPPRHRRGLTVFFTGLSGSGKSTIASGLVVAIREQAQRTVTLLDGDVVRRSLTAGLGFSKADRDVNVRRIGWVAAEITRHHGMAVCAPIAPYSATRTAVRDMVAAVGDFVLVHVATPLEVCEQRDRKGLYQKARAGLITEFTGISDPYETPTDADIQVDTSEISVDEAVGQVIDYLRSGGWLR